jgi:hypothetical protein
MRGGLVGPPVIAGWRVGKAKRDPVMDRLEDLLRDHSMPGIVAALIRLSREYKEQLKRERNSEYQGWESWEDALTVSFREAAMPEELDE